MFTRWPTTWLLAAALFLARNLPPLAAAKPPDLPIDPKVTCQPQAQGRTTGARICGAGINSDAELTGELVRAEEPGDCGCRCVCDAIKKCWQFMMDYFAGQSGEKSVSPRDPSCPFLQQQRAAGKTPPAPAGISPLSVIENLQKLEAAQRLYEAAEHYRRIGRRDAACACYEAVQKLCPGSRYDRQAAAQLAEAHRLTYAIPEEQEAAPVEKVDPAGQGGRELLPAPRPDTRPGQDCPDADRTVCPFEMDLGLISVGVRMNCDRGRDFTWTLRCAPRCRQRVDESREGQD